MKKIIEKYKELILYVVFGGLTTLVNFISFWIFEKLGIEYLINNAISWIISVVFAYVTNKLFVFESKSWNLKLVLKEGFEFLMARVFSFAIEEGGLWLFVDILGMKKLSLNILSVEISGAFIAKVVLAVIVVILNYFFSKFIIFAKKEKGVKSDESKDTE